MGLLFNDETKPRANHVSLLSKDTCNAVIFVACDADFPGFREVDYLLQLLLDLQRVAMLLVIWHEKLLLCTTQFCSFEGDLHTSCCEGLLIYFFHTILNGWSSQNTRIKHQYSLAQELHMGGTYRQISKYHKLQTFHDRVVVV